MANKAKKASKRQPTGKAKTAPKRPSTPASALRFAMDTCSISNPFCPEAVSARWPDNSHTKSVGFSITGQTQTLAADANGNGVSIYTPTAQRAGGVVTSGTSNATFTTAMGKFEIPADIVRWRVTSYGIRVSSPLSSMTATGTAHVRLVSPMTGASLAALDYSSIRVDASVDVPISRLINKDLFVVPKPLGDNAHWFQSGNPQFYDYIADLENPGWQFIILGMSGAPASAAALRVQVYYNFEFVFADGSSSQQFAVAPPPDRPAVRQANSGVLASISNFIEGTAERVDSMFKSKAFQLGTRLIAAGATRNPALALTVD